MVNKLVNIFFKLYHKIVQIFRKAIGIIYRHPYSQHFNLWLTLGDINYVSIHISILFLQKSTLFLTFFKAANVSTYDC